MIRKLYLKQDNELIEFISNLENHKLITKGEDDSLYDYNNKYVEKILLKAHNSTNEADLFTNNGFQVEDTGTHNMIILYI